VEDRIEQFQKMAAADPQNELGHLSLGKAYLEAGRFVEALAPLQRAVELNPALSKAYQLLGEAQAQAGDGPAALATWQKGYAVADQRGDRMPAEAMAKRIIELGGTPPASVRSPAPTDVAASPAPAGDGFQCSRCGRPDGRLPDPPFKGQLGRRVFENVCQTCWREWIALGTKVINEMGLQLADPRAQKVYDEHLLEFLQLE
jgi:Fe-S cluster biosynthesis and repair protein YggX